MLDIPDVLLDDATIDSPPDMPPLHSLEGEAADYWKTFLEDPWEGLPWTFPPELTPGEIQEMLLEACEDPNRVAGNWQDCRFWSLQAFSFNCTVAVAQDILAAYGVEISEEALTEIMIREGLLTENGGSIATVGATLDYGGIPTYAYMNATFDNLFAELVAGHKVVIPVDSSELWDQGVFGRMWDWMTDLGGGTADHVVWVTEIDMSNPNNPIVTINDTGHPDGQAAQYPLNDLRDAWADSHFTYIATTLPPGEYVQPDVFS